MRWMLMVDRDVKKDENIGGRIGLVVHNINIRVGKIWDVSRTQQLYLISILYDIVYNIVKWFSPIHECRHNLSDHVKPLYRLFYFCILEPILFILKLPLAQQESTQITRTRCFPIYIIICRVLESNNSLTIWVQIGQTSTLVKT